ncbi:proline-rich protein HaeIII subfamily 1-like [Epinephelus fuscoguttatus]|uniref:proline-rich protein HaeIII subfamily 1-like n=1 Tax=Epinephelus fuscoguttatus TaxID=293821 RepID=UPI0020D08333|nr:proline-rich protein HaeIII subfamily 1-like [Epinephelus fuscoguttatus]
MKTITRNHGQLCRRRQAAGHPKAAGAPRPHAQRAAEAAGHHAGPRTRGGNGQHPQRARDTPQMGGAGRPAAQRRRPKGPAAGARHRPWGEDQHRTGRARTRCRPPAGAGADGSVSPPRPGRMRQARRRRCRKAHAPSAPGTRGPRRAPRPNPLGRAPTNIQERAAHHEQSIPHQDPITEGQKTTASQEAELQQEPTEPPGRHPAHLPQQNPPPPPRGWHPAPAPGERSREGRGEEEPTHPAPPVAAETAPQGGPATPPQAQETQGDPATPRHTGRGVQMHPPPRGKPPGPAILHRAREQTRIQGREGAPNTCLRP